MYSSKIKKSRLGWSGRLFRFVNIWLVFPEALLKVEEFLFYPLCLQQGIEALGIL
jgi:hypothetical protein